MAQRVQGRGEAHLVEHRQPVVAGRAVGAEHHRNAGTLQPGHVRDPGAELEVGARAVADAWCGSTRAMLDLVRLEVDAMGEHHVGAGESDVVEVVDVVAPGRVSNSGDLGQILVGVRLQQPAAGAGELGTADAGDSGCTTARTAARRRSAAGLRPRRASGRPSAAASASERSVSSISAGRNAHPRCPCGSCRR